MQTIELTAMEIIKKFFIGVEASGRHIHLSREDVEFLFGRDYKLTPAKPLSQPGQYACRERLTIAGPKGVIRNVAILGPERPQTQVEVSMTDARVLGIDAPIRLSGDIENTPGITIANDDKIIKKDKGVIIAKRHIHMTPNDAKHFGITDGQTVKLKVFGDRSIVFNEVVVRVSKDFNTFAHIDYDEANACKFSNGMLGLIIQ